MGFWVASWRALVAGAVLGLLPPMAASAAATSSTSFRTAGNIVTIALPVTAIGITLLHDDWRGLGEFAVSTTLTVGSAYVIRQIVRQRRPDHSDFHSLTPPDVALVDSSADYLWSRYGWRYGIPAYLASAVVGYALTDQKKNHWYDTLASGALAFGFNYAIVDRYRPGRYHVTAEAQPGGAMLRIAVNF